jgi:hypothetical protein
VERDTLNQLISQPLRVPFAMVVRHEFCDGAPEMGFTEWHHPIETFFFDRPHEPVGWAFALGACNGVWTTRMPASPSARRTSPLHFRSRSQIRTEYAVICRRHRATDLPHEESVWMRRRANDLHAT